MPDAALDITLRPHRDRLVVALAGEIDLATVGRAYDAVDEVLESDWRHVVLDLREVTFMDGRGLQLLCHLRDISGPRRVFEMVDGRREVSGVLELAGLEDVLGKVHAADLDPD